MDQFQGNNHMDPVMLVVCDAVKLCQVDSEQSLHGPHSFNEYVQENKYSTYLCRLTRKLV